MVSSLRYQSKKVKTAKMKAIRKRFAYDVFLSHTSKDKPAVRELAERLKQDGLRVWLDEWVIQPGDSIPLKIEQGLETMYFVWLSYRMASG
jgi:TIR domain